MIITHGHSCCLKLLKNLPLPVLLTFCSMVFIALSTSVNQEQSRALEYAWKGFRNMRLGADTSMEGTTRLVVVPCGRKGHTAGTTTTPPHHHTHSLSRSLSKTRSRQDIVKRGAWCFNSRTFNAAQDHSSLGGESLQELSISYSIPRRDNHRCTIDVPPSHNSTAELLYSPTYF